MPYRKGRAGLLAGLYHDARRHDRDGRRAVHRGPASPPPRACPMDGGGQLAAGSGSPCDERVVAGHDDRRPTVLGGNVAPLRPLRCRRPRRSCGAAHAPDPPRRGHLFLGACRHAAGVADARSQGGMAESRVRRVRRGSRGDCLCGRLPRRRSTPRAQAASSAPNLARHGCVLGDRGRHRRSDRWQLHVPATHSRRVDVAQRARTLAVVPGVRRRRGSRALRPSGRSLLARAPPPACVRPADRIRRGWHAPP